VSGAATRVRYGNLVLHDHHPSAGDLCGEVRDGLTGTVRKLSPKWFYDERGAELFERITDLDAYYPTRVECSILQRSAAEIAREVGRHALIVEFGSGSGEKTQLLLRHLEDPAAYVPIDISRSQLVSFALDTARRFPELEVLPVCADYSEAVPLPSPSTPVDRVVAFFPGSSIGNFEPRDAQAFLARAASLSGDDGGLLIGVDLQKDTEVLERAYNDPEGVTAAFNLNLLRRINRECGADFDIDAFRHHAFFDARHSRIEMRLVSTTPQTVHLPAHGDGPPEEIRFGEGDFITTEYSHKYDPTAFRRLAEEAGWRIERTWTDADRWFAVFLLGRGTRERRDQAT
jgi:dimethylhistidine N-methyltransferase